MVNQEVHTEEYIQKRHENYLKNKELRGKPIIECMKQILLDGSTVCHSNPFNKNNENENRNTTR